MSDNFEDDPIPAKDRLQAFKANREQREKIIELFAFRRPNGEPLTDVAIAVRVGCLPSEVERIRHEIKKQS